MRLMNFTFKRQEGIGLLELMLSLAIIAVLLIMATRYFQSASQSQKINSAVDMFAGVQGGFQSYKLDGGDLKKMSGTGGIKQLVDDGYLPASYGDGTGVNPWGGDMKINAAGSAGTYTIEMEGLPSDACTSVGGRINQTLGGEAANYVTNPAGCTSPSTSYCAQCSSNKVIVGYPR